MTGPGPPAATIHQPPTGPQLGAATGSLTQGLPLEQISILSLLGLAWSLKVLWSPLGPPTVSAPGPPGAPQEQPWASPKVADNLATAVAIYTPCEYRRARGGQFDAHGRPYALLVKFGPLRP